MKFVKLAATCVVAIAIGVPLATASFARGSMSPLLAKELAVLTDQGISPARAMQALDVQDKVAQADLVRKLQAALGAADAGVWFEPTTAKLHVGATSTASRRTAERVIAQQGLASHVVITHVRSTMAQLLAVQEEWNHKLANLFAREELKTGLEPQRNAVSVTLTSSVPSRERTAIKRQASAASANVLVNVTPDATLNFKPLAKTECETFKREEAFCNRSITPGVRITSGKCFELTTESVGATFFAARADCEKREKGGQGKWTFEVCSAGPEAIPLANRNNTVLLTAGHCIGEEGVGVENWLAKEIAGAEKGIGRVENSVFGSVKENAKEGDYAEILIEPAWQTGKAVVSVFAVTAEWKEMNEKKEKRSYPVQGERLAAAKETNCHVGQTSGESCGEISMVNVVFRPGGQLVEGLVEDTGPKLIVEGGDSGGPWMFVKPNNEVLMEGILSGTRATCINEAGEGAGANFYLTQENCLRGEKGGKGKWTKCSLVAKVEKGAKFYKTLGNCSAEEKAGEGEWERKPETLAFYQPLTQPVKEAAQGPMERFKLELLTTTNEVREGGPFFKVAKFRLVSGELKTIEGALAKEYLLKAAGREIKCGGTTFKGGVPSIIGSEGPTAGTSEETIEFTKCTVKGNGEPCEVEKGAITTEALKDTLAFTNKATAKGESLLTLFEPVKGEKEKILAKVKFVGAGCKVKEAKLEGSVASENLEGGEKSVKREETETEAEKGFFDFPAAPIKALFTESGGVRTEVKPELKLFGEKAELAGRTSVKLETKEKWGVFSK
jgi:hypothetical protein